MFMCRYTILYIVRVLFNFLLLTINYFKIMEKKSNNWVRIVEVIATAILSVLGTLFGTGNL